MFFKTSSVQLGVAEDVFRPRMLELIRDMRIRATMCKPVHISEFGAGAKSGRRGGKALIWSEEYRARVYHAQIAMLRNSPQVQADVVLVAVGRKIF